MLESIKCTDEEASVDDDDAEEDADTESGNGGPKKAYGVSIHATRTRRTVHSVSSEDCSSERENGVSVCAVATRAGERTNR